MPEYNKATFVREGRQRKVIYQDDAGNIEIKNDGTRSWRNNNPGNIKASDWNWAQEHGAIGKDVDGFAIFKDFQTGWNAKNALLNEKYGNYNSIREMLKGKLDKDGNYIPGTGYAPKSDGNNPNLYADTIKKWTGLDVENKKISDLTSDEMSKLLDAMKRYEG